ncbi:TetR/AcrR family transcriptional regulator [Sorangium sp. So ce176]|uniref:TetR/AcrR family transcriptional regulator n=1 Tax=Sorangium sp. So ce176 TaxID=3133286 RepID=UPI003F646F18
MSDGSYSVRSHSRGAAHDQETAPRKLATQQRAQLTVDALLTATARILAKEGYDTASTNKIALAAGVGIGSLYQYFPGKEALVAAVIDRHMEEMMDMVRLALADVIDQPVEASVRRLVAVMVDAHRVDPRLHRVLFEQLPRVGRLANVEALHHESYALVRGYLDVHRDASRGRLPHGHVIRRAASWRPSIRRLRIASRGEKAVPFEARTERGEPLIRRAPCAPPRRGSDACGSASPTVRSPHGPRPAWRAPARARGSMLVSSAAPCGRRA